MCLLSYVAYFKINLINGFTHLFFATAMRVTERGLMNGECVSNDIIDGWTDEYVQHCF